MTIDRSEELISPSPSPSYSYDQSEIMEITREPIRKAVEKEIKNQLLQDRTNLITVFGIFASIVTFLSVEIQFLKIVCDPLRLVGFSFFILAGLLLFIFLLHYMAINWLGIDPSTDNIKSISKKGSFQIFFLAILVALIIGYIGMRFGVNEYTCKVQSNNDEIRKQARQEMNNDLNRLKEKNSRQQDIIEDQQEQINILKEKVEL